jgi:hypothetical protein
MKKTIKAFAKVTKDGKLQMYTNAFSPFTIFASKEQAEALEHSQQVQSLSP